MSVRIDILISKLRAYYESNPSAVWSPPAKPEEIDVLRTLSLSGQTIHLDSTYFELVSKSDGIAAEGTKVYGLVRRTLTNFRGKEVDRQGVREANIHWREVYGPDSIVQKLVIYGLSDTTFFCFDIVANAWQHRSRTGLSTTPLTFDTFDECIWEAFRYPLALD